MTDTPEWARWPDEPHLAPYSIGIEEELMLLEPNGRLAFRSEEALGALPGDVAKQASLETHAAVVEIETRPCETVGEVVSELSDVRARLAFALHDLGLRPAGSGTHPTATWEQTKTSAGSRYQDVLDSMRVLASREPTMAMHVQVGVPDANAAVRVLNWMRLYVPLILGLAANSPYWQGRDTGLASSRTPLFDAFPRTGIPGYFSDYEEWVERVDVLVRCGAIPEPTFLWWDVRLQPRYGTIEVRTMDTQSRLSDVAALAALIQSLVKLLCEGKTHEPNVHPEALRENRFLAARDGVRSRLIQTELNCLSNFSERLRATTAECREHAEDLGCSDELDRLEDLIAGNGAIRQRVVGNRDGITAVAPWLAHETALG